MKNVIKRDGRKMPFNGEKIYSVVRKSVEDTYPEETFKKINELVESITAKTCKTIEELDKDNIDVEKVQNIIEKVLKQVDEKVKQSFSNYRKERTNVREIKSDLMKSIGKIGVETDRDNANVGNNFSSKLLRIASESNKWYMLASMPKHLAKAHEIGDVYFHDLDSYNLTINCLHIPTGKMLEKGFNTGYGTILPPKRIESAAELSCILLQATQNDMFGGQSHPNFDTDLGQFIEPTRQEIRLEIMKEIIRFNKIISVGTPNIKSFSIEDQKMINELTEERLIKTTHQAMQAIVYNLNTMHSRAGSQVPFSSVNIGLPENDDDALICKTFLEEYDKGLGMGEQPIFPNIIFRVKEGLNKKPSDKYYYLFQLACKIAAKRMNPTFMSMDSSFNKVYYTQGIKPATMGCRTYVCANINGEAGPEGRGNIAPATINLPRIGMLAKGDINKFYELLQERLETAREILTHRYGVLKQLRVKDLPFVAGQGLIKGSEGLQQDDSIEPILKQGTWGIGFIGLAETLVALLGVHHGESIEARKLGEEIVSYLRKYTDNLTIETQLNWSTYATPAEGLSGKFTLMDRKTFGIIPGVTDKEYYTNSFHVPVGFNIGIQDKIEIEAPYHAKCNAGHISYVELDDYPTESIIEKIIINAFDTTDISYIGINFHIRYCKKCGTYLHSEDSCSKCGSKEIQGISRVTGYLSLDERFGPGKLGEKVDRKSHITGNKNYKL
jgi:anaerobic ribonucleoside-triphosphate reductase